MSAPDTSTMSPAERETFYGIRVTRTSSGLRLDAAELKGRLAAFELAVRGVQLAYRALPPVAKYHLRHHPMLTLLDEIRDEPAP